MIFVTYYIGICLDGLSQLTNLLPCNLFGWEDMDIVAMMNDYDFRLTRIAWAIKCTWRSNADRRILIGGRVPSEF